MNFKYSNELNFLWETVGNELKVLSRETILSIMTEYYSCDRNVKSIMKKYNLSFSPNRLNLNFPQIVINKTCKYDQTCLQMKLPSRTILSSNYNESNIYCPQCGHEPHESFCMCKNCQLCRERQNEIEKEREIKLEKIKRKKLIELTFKEPKIKIKDLNLKEKLYISAMLQSLASEDLLEIGPYINKSESITPFEEKDLEILSDFYDKDYLKVDGSKTDVNILDIINNGGINFAYYMTTYQLNFREDLNDVELYKILRHPDRKEFLENKVKTFELWRKIAIDECLAYLNYRFAYYHFPKFKAGRKTIDTFSSLLTNFSTSQIFNLIYMSVKSAAAYTCNASIPIRRAQNSAITNLNHYAGRARDENWNLIDYHIPYNMGKGSAVDIFYNEILQIGSKGSTQVPSIDIIEKLAIK